MGTITVVDNLFEPQNSTKHEWTGQYIDWLEAHYPTGFQCKHYTYVNRKLLDVVNYDREVSKDDSVLLVFTPAGVEVSIGTMLVTALISTAVSVGLNFIFSKLFPTKTPATDAASASVPAAGSVYSLSIPTNRIRLGEPIPVVYGEVLWTPDICTQPFSRYENNEQYVFILLGLGHGEFTDITLQIADTPVSQMAAGIVQYQIHGPTDHQQRLGNVEAAWLGRFIEDMDTSVEVSDQELVPPALHLHNLQIDPVGNAIVDPALAGDVSIGTFITTIGARLNNSRRTITGIDAPRTSIDVTPPYLNSWSLSGTPTAATITIDTVAMTVQVTWSGSTIIPSTSDFLDSDSIMAPTYADTITFTYSAVIYIITGVLTGGYGTRDITLHVTDFGGADTVLADNTVTSVTVLGVTFEANTYFEANVLGDTTNIGPFVVSHPTTTIRSVEFDFIFPGGLYGIDERAGNLITATCDIAYKLDTIDDNGDVIVAGTWVVVSYSGANNTPRRETVIVTPTVARYRAHVKRISPKSTKAADNSNVIWSGLKGALVNDLNREVYGDVTLVSVMIKATNGISSDATNRIGVRAKRLIPTLAVPTGAISSNPADHLRDIITNDAYGANRPTTEIDYTADAALYAWSIGKNGFNGIFEQKTTVWSAMESVLIPVHASPVTYGAQISSVIDQTLTTPKFLFDANNIVDGSIEYGWAFVEVDGPDGFEVEYRRNIDWVADYELYPSTSLNPEKVVLFGCTDQATAQAHAKYLWQRRTYRRKLCTFTTELEGHLPQLGDLIRINHSLGGDEQYVVSTIDPKDKYRVTIEAYKYAPEVFQ